jgi:hypothetical protein
MCQLSVGQAGLIAVFLETGELVWVKETLWIEMSLRAMEKQGSNEAVVLKPNLW